MLRYFFTYLYIYFGKSLGIISLPTYLGHPNAYSCVVGHSRIPRHALLAKSLPKSLPAPFSKIHINKFFRYSSLQLKLFILGTRLGCSLQVVFSQTTDNLPDQRHVYHSSFLKRFLLTRGLQIPQNSMDHSQYAIKIQVQNYSLKIALLTFIIIWFDIIIFM